MRRPRQRGRSSSKSDASVYRSQAFLKRILHKLLPQSYSDQTFPFNRGFYPGDLSQAALRPVGPGDITATLTFSQSMDPSWTGFNVQLAPQGGAPPVNFDNGSWSRTNSDNDTWTGSVTIPSDGSGWDGTAVVAVTARDASQLEDDPGGTLDTDGDGAADGTSRMISFPGDYLRLQLIELLRPKDLPVAWPL